MTTTYVQRFAQALHLITGAMPPSELVDCWVAGVERPDDLQNWVGELRFLPEWCQNIGALDAADAMASAPVEGEGHDITRPPYLAALSRIATLERRLAQFAQDLGTPRAYAVFAENGNIRVWWSADAGGRNERAAEWAAAHVAELVPLYAPNVRWAQALLSRYRAAHPGVAAAWDEALATKGGAA